MLVEALIANRLSREAEPEEPTVSESTLKAVLVIGAFLMVLVLWRWIAARRRSGGASIIADEVPFVEWKG